MHEIERGIFGRILWCGSLDAKVDEQDFMGGMYAHVARTDVGSLIVEVKLIDDPEWQVPYSFLTDSFDPPLPVDLREELGLK